jgi:hypothetical protein
MPKKMWKRRGFIPVEISFNLEFFVPFSKRDDIAGPNNKSGSYLNSNA